MVTKFKILNHIKDTVIIFIPEAEIRLFGSRVRSDSESDSDYDILVITDQSLTPSNKFFKNIHSKRITEIRY